MPRQWLKWTENDRITLTQVYSNLSKEDIQKLLPSRSWGSIKTYARSLGLSRNRIPKTKCILDFSKVDSEEKAYLIGFIAADGNISKRTANRRLKTLNISLAEKDEAHLKLLRNLLCPNSVIRKCRKRIGQNMYEFSLWDTETCDSLIKLGIVPNKSKILRLPDIDNFLFMDYLRGYFDGDGSFYTDKSNILHAELVSGSELFLADINEKLKLFLGLSSTITKCKTAFRLRYYNNNAIILAKGLYANATISLDRKYNIIKNFI